MSAALKQTSDHAGAQVTFPPAPQESAIFVAWILFVSMHFIWVSSRLWQWAGVEPVAELRPHYLVGASGFLALAAVFLWAFRPWQERAVAVCPEGVIFKRAGLKTFSEATAFRVLQTPFVGVKFGRGPKFIPPTQGRENEQIFKWAMAALEANPNRQALLIALERDRIVDHYIGHLRGCAIGTVLAGATYAFFDPSLAPIAAMPLYFAIYGLWRGYKPFAIELAEFRNQLS